MQPQMREEEGRALDSRDELLPSEDLKAEFERETSWMEAVAELRCLLNLNVCGLDDNVFVLICLFLATTSFTVAQFVGAVKANSLSMYGDCATMALDSLTYLLNIYCEKNRISGSTEAVRLEIVGASISVAALTFVTIFLLWDSIQRSKIPHGKDEVV